MNHLETSSARSTSQRLDPWGLNKVHAEDPAQRHPGHGTAILAADSLKPPSALVTQYARPSRITTVTLIPELDAVVAGELRGRCRLSWRASFRT